MKIFKTLSLIILCSISVGAQAHGDHNEQDAYIEDTSKLGLVQFSNSCRGDWAENFNTGLALLHHMMYAQAGDFFAQVMNDSPDCAMAHWGYAMSLFHPLWPDRIQNQALADGLKTLNRANELPASPREKQFIAAALAYFRNWQAQSESERLQRWADAQSDLHARYPADTDAAALHALAQLAIAPKDDPTFSRNAEMGALLETLRLKEPRHPGVLHYQIHAFDNPVLAQRAVPAARAYDGIAPDVPHALHMPSHIFVRLGIWPDAVQWNIRSANAALKYPVKKVTSLHYAHALDYLIYAYLQLGDMEDAVKAQAEMETKHPFQAVFPTAFAFAAIPARLTLEQANWQGASELAARHPDYIPWDKFPHIEAITHYAIGVGAARLGDADKARRSHKRLEQLHQLAREHPIWAKRVRAQSQAVGALILYLEDKPQQALAAMKQAADLQDSIDKDPVTPGAVLPIRELLADLLLEEENFEQAIQAYESSLAMAPNRRYSQQGIARAEAAMKRIAATSHQ